MKDAHHSLEGCSARATSQGEHIARAGSSLDKGQAASELSPRPVH